MDTLSPDDLWKGIIEELPEFFIRYFFPKQAELVDFSEPIAVLNTELRKVKHLVAKGKKHADSLLRIKLKDGSKQLMLIHVEVQGYHDPAFPARMYEYYKRIEDKFGLPLTSLAVFTDARKEYHKSLHRKECWGTSMEFRYQVFDVHATDEEAIVKGHESNPFAYVMLAAKKKLTLKEDVQRVNWKLAIYRELLSAKFEQEIIRSVWFFVENYVNLKNENNVKEYEEKKDKIDENQRSMGITELVLRHDKKQLAQAKKEFRKELRSVKTQLKETERIAAEAEKERKALLAEIERLKNAKN